MVIACIALNIDRCISLSLALKELQGATSNCISENNVKLLGFLNWTIMIMLPYDIFLLVKPYIIILYQIVVPQSFMPL